MKKIAFIGGGNMGGALITGICKAINPNDLIVYDVHIEKSEALSKKTGCCVATSIDCVEDAEYIVLAVKPQILEKVIDSIIPYLNKAVKNGVKQKIISIAGGVTLFSLTKQLNSNGLDLSVIRMLPNTPSEIGEGLNIYCVNELVTDEICIDVEKMFSKCGLIEKIDESVLDMSSAISGCTPAFAYMFIDGLADGAVRCGVPRDKAIRYAAQAVKGAAAMVLETGRHPGELKDAVCSPGGSTIVGVSTLEDSAFRSASANAVFNANEKNISLGKD